MMRILAATDFSDESQKVLDFAAQLTEKCAGKMYLLHAVAPYVIDALSAMEPTPMNDPLMGAMPASPNGAEIVNDDTPLVELADKRAKEQAEEIGRQWNIPIYGKAEDCDDIKDCILNFCKRHNIDMLVIGNRHHTLLSSIFLGNTADKLMRASSIPICIVPCKAS